MYKISCGYLMYRQNSTQLPRLTEIYTASMQSISCSLDADLPNALRLHFQIFDKEHISLFFKNLHLRG